MDALCPQVSPIFVYSSHLCSSLFLPGFFGWYLLGTICTPDIILPSWSWWWIWWGSYIQDTRSFPKRLLLWRLHRRLGFLVTNLPVCLCGLCHHDSSYCDIYFPQLPLGSFVRNSRVLIVRLYVFF